MCKTIKNAIIEIIKKKLTEEKEEEEFFCRHKCIKGENYCYVYLVKIIKPNEQHLVSYLLVFSVLSESEKSYKISCN